MNIIDLKEYHSPDAAVHFIGCSGVGTAPLMRIFHEKGFRVSGSDLSSSPEEESLHALGIPVFIGPHSAEHLPDCRKLLLVYTSAANNENPEITAAAERGALMVRRGEALGAIAREFPKVISVSGSHGKTSVTAMIAYVLRELGEHPGFLIGGKTGTFPFSGSAGGGKFFVTEADESDGTHSLLQSCLGIVTNVEDDHVWSLGGLHVLKKNFAKFAAQSEKLLFWEGPITDELFGNCSAAVRITDSEFCPEQIFSESENALKGDFQLKNEYTACCALEILGFSRARTLPLLAKFPGVDRRLSVRLDTPALRIVEDYAHHPTELRESLKALRKTNPNRRLLVVFQPHRYARLERYFSDFSRELSAADKVFILPVFAAWTSEGKYTSDDLAESIGSGTQSLHGDMTSMADTIVRELLYGDVLCVIGAGNSKDLIPHFLRGQAENA